MHKNNPSHKELSSRIKKARELFREGSWRFVKEQTSNILEDLIELNIPPGKTEEYVRIFLNEVSVEDYAGSFPPELSYLNSIKNEALYAFSWSSRILEEEKVYLKFCIIDSILLVFVSIHQDRPKRRRP